MLNRCLESQWIERRRYRQLVQYITLYVVAGQIVQPVQGGIGVCCNGVVNEQFGCERIQRGVVVPMCVEVRNQIVADAYRMRGAKRRLIEGDGLLVEEHAHQGGQPTTETVAGEADGSAGVGGLNFKIVERGFAQLAGTQAQRKPRIGVPV